MFLTLIERSIPLQFPQDFQVFSCISIGDPSAITHSDYPHYNFLHKTHAGCFDVGFSIALAIGPMETRGGLRKGMHCTSTLYDNVPEMMPGKIEHVRVSSFVMSSGSIISSRLLHTARGWGCRQRSYGSREIKMAQSLR
jgi:hypothetical protein